MTLKIRGLKKCILHIQRIWKLIGLYILKVRADLPEFHFGTQEHILVPAEKHFDNSKNYEQNFLAYISTPSVRTSNLALNQHLFWPM